MVHLATALLSFLLLALGTSAAPSRKLLLNDTATVPTPARKLSEATHTILQGGGNGDLFVACDPNTKRCKGEMKDFNAATRFSIWTDLTLPGERQLRIPNADGVGDMNLCLTVLFPDRTLGLAPCIGEDIRQGIVTGTFGTQMFDTRYSAFGRSTVTFLGEKGIWWGGVDKPIAVPVVPCNADLAWQCMWHFTDVAHV